MYMYTDIVYEISITYTYINIFYTYIYEISIIKISLIYKSLYLYVQIYMQTQKAASSRLLGM